ncbi:MAG TPA: zinc-binding alcohol dehydrogenase family protein, partial [Acidothermaceae bacterium]|nr:zinc-binding alcohol dehydrogenase family protein [Acidothermaceae bacterium]
ICIADERFVYVLPAAISDEHAAPLLCAGIIGYRALLAASVPVGGRLGLYGFGGSAHLTAQIALHLGMRVHVLTRGEHNQQLARQLGVASVGEAAGAPPEPLDGAILFAPAGELVPVALRALDAGGTLAVAGIWLSDIPALNYEAELFRERRLRSVTANTRQDGEEFLQLAERFDIRATTVAYDMAEAPRALSDLSHGRFGGAAVLHN